MKSKYKRRPAFTQSATLTQTQSAKPKPPKDTQPDYCLTCRLPVNKCKGNCTEKQRKINGGKQ